MSEPPQSAVPILISQRESIARMSEHFDALMDMGRFQDGQFELTISRVRLDAFAARIDREIAPLCAEKGLAWLLDIENMQVATDEELLLRLLRNLLINAVRFTGHGEVLCSARAKGDVVEFLISDTGCGIAAEYHEAVFKEFVRLENNGFRSPGMGIGLSIVEKINRALDLGLRMTSTVGQGTRFSFCLPLAREG